MYKRYIKRVLDLIVSGLGIVLLTPVWLFLAVVIVVDDPGPVFFRQKRIAKNKDGDIQYFQIYKYRTMKMDAPHDVPTHLLEHPEQYITKVGRFLRKTSLDELPQVFNVFLGQMSFIGPRPALWNQTDLYCEREKYKANDIVPGLTGWAQINGRDELAIFEKARLDGEYCQKLSFRMDMRCFFKTIISVIRRESVVEGSQEK